MDVLLRSFQKFSEQLFFRNDKNELLTKFLKGVRKIVKFPGENLYWSFFLVYFKPTNYSLQSSVFLKFGKIHEIACAVEFLFTEAGRIAASQNSFLENLLVYLKRTPR